MECVETLMVSLLHSSSCHARTYLLDLTLTSNTALIIGTMPKPRAASKTKSAITTYPCQYFFYGSLCDPAVLSRVLGRKETVEHFVYRDVSIHGFTVKAWGQYTGLIDSEDAEAVVEGRVFRVENEKEEHRLCVYETAAYEVVGVNVRLDDGSEVEGNVFRYAGNHRLLK